MTSIATTAGNSWSVSIGGGWIVLMLIGMGLCFVFMLSSMRFNGHGWTMCSRWWWQQQTPPTAIATGEPGQKPNPSVPQQSEARP